MDMELCITGPEPAKIDHTLYCHMMNLALTEKLSHCEYLANMQRIIGELLCSQ